MAANGLPIEETTEYWAEEKVYSTGTFYAQETMYITNGIYAKRKVAFVTEYWAQKKVVIAGCFPKTELVLGVYDICVPIGSLKVGDKISTWDAERNKAQYTAVTKIQHYKVMEIFCFNNVMNVSSFHPIMVMVSEEDGIYRPKWKVAFDVNIGDYLVGANGKLIPVKTKSMHWYNAGKEVLNLSTDGGVPFLVGNFVVRSENAYDSIEWVDTPVTKKLIA